LYSGRRRKDLPGEVVVAAVEVAAEVDVAVAEVDAPEEAEAHGLAAEECLGPAEECPGRVEECLGRAAAPGPAEESPGRVVAVPLVAALPGQEAAHRVAVRHPSVNPVGALVRLNCRPVARA
jgi:hypothetical protein